MSHSYERIDVITPVLSEEEEARTFHARISRPSRPLNLTFIDSASPNLVTALDLLQAVHDRRRLHGEGLDRPVLRKVGTRAPH